MWFKKAKPDVTLEESPSQDRSTRFPLDALLRLYGFRILARTKNGEALWGRGDDTFTQTQALRQVPRSEVQDALYQEELYFDGLQS